MSRGMFDEFNRGRVRKEQHRAGRRAMRARAVGAPNPVTLGQPTPQAVIKVVSWGKSSRSALTTARYITRTRPKDPDGRAISAINADGHEVAPEALAAYLKGWQLIPDEQNLSGDALRAEPGARWRMPEKDRLNKRQIGHMILSVPPTAGATPEKMHAIGRDTLHDVFGEVGIDYLWVVHDDHSRRPHIHVVFEATKPNGRQLRMGPEDLRIIREIFAERARENGIELAATAREDRPELAQDIAAGRVRARERHRYIDGRKQEHDDEMPWLARQAPLYHARHGAAYQSRIAGKHGAAIGHQPVGQGRPSVPAASIQLPPLPKKQARHVEKASQSFVDPTAAYAAFTELYAESPKAALWAMNNRPEVYGVVDETRPAPSLYLREKEQVLRSAIETPETKEAKADAVDRLMTTQYGPKWREDMDQQILGSDAPRHLPIVQALNQARAQVGRDPQFTVDDPNAESLKAWREQARAALSRHTPEPRQVAAARVAATHAAGVELKTARQARMAQQNRRITASASARHDAPGARQAPGQAPKETPAPKTQAAPQAPAAGTPAAGKALPGWMQRMFRRGENKAPASRGSAPQIDTAPQTKAAPAPQPTPQGPKLPEKAPTRPVPAPGQSPQAPQATPAPKRRRDRSRDDDRER